MRVGEGACWALLLFCDLEWEWYGSHVGQV